jgi:uncharacterized membrane protein
MMTGPPSRSSTGWDPVVIAALAYVLGCLSGIAVLVIEKESRYVRFHATQSVITFLAVLVAGIVVGNLPAARVFYPFFVTAVAVLWVFLMFKAVNGETYKLPYIGDLAERRSS